MPSGHQTTAFLGLSLLLLFAIPPVASGELRPLAQSPLMLQLTAGTDYRAITRPYDTLIAYSELLYDAGGPAPLRLGACVGVLLTPGLCATAVADESSMVFWKWYGYKVEASVLALGVGLRWYPFGWPVAIGVEALPTVVFAKDGLYDCMGRLEELNGQPLSRAWNAWGADIGLVLSLDLGVLHLDLKGDYLLVRDFEMLRIGLLAGFTFRR